jgi:hypothetical protein
MKKTFPLSAPGKHPDRVVDAVKYELRKYLRRENRRKLPEGADYWDFDCRTGENEAVARVIKPADIIPGVDAAVKAGWPAVYMEILARPVTRPKRPEAPTQTPRAASADSRES